MAETLWNKGKEATQAVEDFTVLQNEFYNEKGDKLDS